jgi:hypothetical protein
MDSVSLLRPDQVDTAITLLQSIAESQLRMEAGRPDASPSPVQRLPFEPSPTARWINILWFLSLALSLGAAMVAILAKEWLSWFLHYQTKVAREFSLERQYRFEGLESWRAIGLIDAFPTILHVSLLLFTIGLTLRLWLIDPIVASVFTAVSGLFALFYIGTVTFGALKEHCPYKANLVEYIKGLVGTIRARFCTNSDAAKSIQDQIRRLLTVKALQWFLDNTTDPYEANHVYRDILEAQDSSHSHIKILLRPNEPDKMNDPQYYLEILMLGAGAVRDLKDKTNENRIRFLRNNFDYQLTRHATVISDVIPYANKAAVDAFVKRLKSDPNMSRVQSELQNVVSSIDGLSLKDDPHSSDRLGSFGPKLRELWKVASQTTNWFLLPMIAPELQLHCSICHNILNPIRRRTLFIVLVET